MKTPIFILLFFSASITEGQLPVFFSNTTSKDSATSFIFKEYGSKYDFLFAYSEESYWRSNKEDYRIIGLKGDKCFLIRQTKKEKITGKPAMNKSSIDQTSFLNLLRRLTQNNFWILDKDSLDQRCIDFTDSTKKCLDISDGVNYKFQVITAFAYMKIESYMPDDYVKKFPSMTQRKIFIECRDLFEKYWRTKE